MEPCFVVAILQFDNFAWQCDGHECPSYVPATADQSL